MRSVLVGGGFLLIVAVPMTLTWPDWWPATRVTVVQPESRELVELVVASGRLRALRQAEIGTQVSGIVDHVFVEEGDQVTAGQALVSLAHEDVRQRVEEARLAVGVARYEAERVRAGAKPEEIRRAQAEMERAQAILRRAEQELERARIQFKRDLIAKVDLERAESEVPVAQANQEAARQTWLGLAREPRAEDVRVADARLREAEASLRMAEAEAAKRVIVAPFEGLVVRRRVEPGQGLTAGQAVLALADMTRTELVVETDENNLARLQARQRALVVAPGYPRQPFEAVLTRLGPGVDSQRGVVTLRFTPLSLPSYARPDMTVDVSIQVAQLPNALSVPSASVIERDGQTFVLVVENHFTRLQRVHRRGSNPDRTAVEGIAADAWVVAHPSGIQPNSLVRPVPHGA